MKIIVPLAGPDFVSGDGTVKSEFRVDGVHLLRRALESRSWWVSGLVSDRDLIFVLHDDAISRRFSSEKLLAWYPAARTVFLSAFTRGAAFSVLAGCGLVGDLDETICFDLADILFADQSNAATFFSDPTVGAVALTFPSSRSVYSYLRRNEMGEIVEAAEKRVISDEASAGVYFFRSIAIYLKALANVVDHEEDFTYRNLFFVCPVFNGVFPLGLKVAGVAVTDVRDVKTELGTRTGHDASLSGLK